MQQLRFLIHVVVLVVCDRYNLSWYEEGALLDDLPQPTKQAVLRENCGTMLQSMPLFVSAHMVRQAVWSCFVARLVRDGGFVTRTGITCHRQVAFTGCACERREAGSNDGDDVVVLLSIRTVCQVMCHDSCDC